MVPNDLVARARRGEAEAIAQLINQSLAAAGIRAEAEWQADHLEIILEGANLPAASLLVPKLRQGFERLAMGRAIAAVDLYARRPGRTLPDWAVSFTLPLVLDPASDLAPEPEPEPASDPNPAAADRLAAGGSKLDLQPAPDLTDAPAVGLEPDLASALDAEPEEAPEEAPEEIPEEIPEEVPEELPGEAPDPSSAFSQSPTASPLPTSAAGPAQVSAPAASPLPAPQTRPPTAYLSDTALVTLVHLAPLLGYLSWAGFGWIGLPLFWTGSFLLPWRVIAPLGLLLFKGQDSPLIKKQAEAALNFQLSLSLYWLGVGALMFVLIGFLLVVPLAVFEIVSIIIAAVKASEGKTFRYPLTIRFIR